MKHVLIVGFLWLTSISHAEKKPVKVQLISEMNGIISGQTFNLGLHIQHEKGWHTYWKNPGDVGLAPTIKWELPKGFEAMPFLWASPEIHKMGIIDVQAYHGEVTHILPIKAPIGLENDSLVTLKGRLSWLMCSKQCIPAFQDVSIKLPVLKQPTFIGKWKEGFVRTKTQQPVVVEGWNITALDKGKIIEMQINPREGLPKTPAKPWFFCDENHITTQKHPEYKQLGRGLVMRMSKTEWAPAKITQLSGHLNAPKGWDRSGKIKNLRVSIPVGTLN